MRPIAVMANGLPGKMAHALAAHIHQSHRFQLLPWSLTGPDITDRQTTVDSIQIELIRPEQRRQMTPQIVARAEHPIIIADFTHPDAVNGNAEFYCRNSLPFVMGTTGGDRHKLFETVRQSSICAVIAPNMAKQIVGLQAMFEFAATTFPGLFSNFSMHVKESHQQGKADTSGTAKAIIECCQKLGMNFDPADIYKERDPHVQQRVWNIPSSHIKGHGWHTYTFESSNKLALFEFTHNINGRDIYAQGTLDAIDFLSRQIANGARGRVYSMIDVIKDKDNQQPVKAEMEI